MNRVYILKRLILDLFYPNRCGMCGCEIPFDEYFCNTCVKLFSSADKNALIPYVDHFTAYAVYDSFGKEFAGRFKNDGDGYAISGAAYLIYKALVKESGSALKETDIITYVPMRKRDIYKRGYDQCRLIANETAQLSNKPCISLLKKIRSTKPQKTLTAEERAVNVKDAFSCSKGKIVKGRNILIVDDICTTGSTLSEAARALKNAGAKTVNAAVFAKTRLYFESGSGDKNLISDTALKSEQKLSP